MVEFADRLDYKTNFSYTAGSAKKVDHEPAKAMTARYKATSQQSPMANTVELPNSQAAVTSIWMALISLPKIFQHLL
ncbi:MAG: hypothetical protein ABIL62_13300 [Planctomycetota bacterium]